MRIHHCHLSLILLQLMEFELLKGNDPLSEQQENSLACYLTSRNIAHVIICSTLPLIFLIDGGYLLKLEHLTQKGGATS